MVEVGDRLRDFGNPELERRDGRVSLMELHSNEPLVKPSHSHRYT